MFHAAIAVLIAPILAEFELVLVPKEITEYPRPYTHMVSQVGLCFHILNSCPCENTHGRPFCLLYVCRIGLVSVQVICKPIHTLQH